MNDELAQSKPPPNPAAQTDDDQAKPQLSDESAASDGKQAAADDSLADASESRQEPAPHASPPEGINLMHELIQAQQALRAAEQVRDQAQSDAQSRLDDLLRERAAFANFKRRTEREKEASFQRAAQDTIKHFLPILDDLARALDNLPPTPDAEAWSAGVANVQRKFLQLLEQLGVTEIDATGTAFDPSWHTAVSMEPSDTVESGTVIATLQKGYRAGETVLRPAMVTVAQ